MYIKILFFLFTYNILIAQDYLIKDTIVINEKSYNYVHLSFGKTSLQKSFKIMTCTKGNFNLVKDEIVKCFKKNKLEYTEFYLLVMDNIDKKKSEKVILKLLNKIDKNRIENNLSTGLINYKYNIQSNKYEYLIKNPKKTLYEFEDYSINIRPINVCNFLYQ